MITPETLSAAMGGQVSSGRYKALAPAYSAAMVAADCTTVRRAAMWAAQLGHESGGLRWMEELATGAAYNGRRDLGNLQPGDGPRFKGRGPIQVTGRHNYGQLSVWAHSKGLVDTPTFFVDQPHQLSSDQYGFLGAVWYWTVARPGINAMCDREDLTGVTRAINGGTNGLADRRARWERCLRIGDALLGGSTPTPVVVIPQPAGRPTIRQGSKGPDVRDLQTRLNRNYPLYSRLVIDGVFGPATDAVVREFQRRSGLAADGVVGPITWKALGG